MCEHYFRSRTASAVPEGIPRKKSPAVGVDRIYSELSMGGGVEAQNGRLVDTYSDEKHKRFLSGGYGDTFASGGTPIRKPCLELVKEQGTPVSCDFELASGETLDGLVLREIFEIQGGRIYFAAETAAGNRVVLAASYDFKEPQTPDADRTALSDD